MFYSVLIILGLIIFGILSLGLLIMFGYFICDFIVGFLSIFSKKWDKIYKEHFEIGGGPWIWF